MVYYPGKWKIVCDICAAECYNTESKKTWDNLIVCLECFDGPRNPQDYRVRPKSDRQTVRDPRPEKADKPTVLETVTPSSVADTTATSGGKVANNGGSTVTAKGVCWSTSPAPDVDDDVTDEGAGTNFSCSDTTYVTEATCNAAMLEWSDNFTSSITGLTASTKYYLRAYATNAVGVGYGPTIEFTTTA
jgi:hypothetical protein